MHYLLERMKSYDLKTYYHSLNVEKVTNQMADILGLTLEEKDLLKTAATFHDCGKMMLNPNILNSPNELSKPERIAIDFHSYFSYTILKELEFDQDICEIVSIHHGMDKYRTITIKETNKKLGEILKVCDIYCALRENRTYCKTMTQEEAIAKMKTMDVDQSVVNQLSKLDEKYLEITFEENKKEKKKWGPFSVPQNRQQNK